MSRELRRVPLDFDWPINKPWDGWVSPTPRPCPAKCLSGWSNAAMWLRHFFYLMTVYAEEVDFIQSGKPRNGRRMPHPWLGIPYPPGDWEPRSSGVGNEFVPLPVNDPRIGLLLDNLGCKPGFSGRNSTSDASVITKILLDAAGMDHDDFLLCSTCRGLGYHPDDKTMMDSWEDTDPPGGDGFQVWETVSSGSPQSPVFITAAEVYDWCAANLNLPGQQFHGTAADWERLLDTGIMDEWVSEDGIRVVMF